MIIDWKGIDIDVEYTHTPERPAPPCCNPDSPAFSDPGDPEEFEIDKASYKHNGVVVDMTPLIDASDELREELEQIALDTLRDAPVDDRESWDE